MDLKKKLAAAETVEDLEAILPSIDRWNDSFIFSAIRSPIVLDACLRYVNPTKSRLLEIFYLVARLHRVDLLKVFFDSFLTLEDLSTSLTWNYSFFIGREVIEGAVDVIAFFLEKGLDPNLQSFWCGEGSLLSLACSYNKIDIVDLLLEYGANVNHQDIAGRTPAFHAMRAPDVRILDRLIVHGANLYRRDKDGNNLWTAVAWCYYEETLEPNFQRLADMRVPLDEETYNSALAALDKYPKLEGLISIMRKI